MTTARQIERLWDDRCYARLAETLSAGRTDVGAVAPLGLRSSSAAAALAVIRLDELGQNAHPLCGRLVRALIAAQQPDGGWGDLGVSVLAIRALRCGRGDGFAITRGIEWLAALQKDDAAWPAEPIRRLSPDAAMTTFVLLHLGNDPALNAVARLDDAIAWLARHQDEMDASTRRAAERVTVRRRRANAAATLEPAGLFFFRPAWS